MTAECSRSIRTVSCGSDDSSAIPCKSDMGCTKARPVVAHGSCRGPHRRRSHAGTRSSNFDLDDCRVQSTKDRRSFTIGRPRIWLALTVRSQPPVRSGPTTAHAVDSSSSCGRIRKFPRREPRRRAAAHRRLPRRRSLPCAAPCFAFECSTWSAPCAGEVSEQQAVGSRQVDHAYTRARLGCEHERVSSCLVGRKVEIWLL